MPSNDMALQPRYSPDHSGRKQPLLVMLDETPRAAQTLRFAIDHLIHTATEDICVMFALPPCTSTLLKQKVTTRIRSFLTLCTERYTATKPSIKLFLLDRADILDAVADLCEQLDPRMLVMGSCNVSFLPHGSPERTLVAGTGAAGAGYYTSAFVSAPPSSSTAPSSPTLSGRSSYSSVGGTYDAEQGSLTDARYRPDGSFLSGLWTTISGMKRMTVLNSNHHGAPQVPEGKSAYVVEGLFAQSVKEHVSVPVVIVQVALAV
ncbi:hypothetical protein BC830DRAFT_1150210 [Chytriomyces sp. MP71]|nr:hypothetical protein BC830DRAFT_1150210 [Chytriomyces sp. MP71]